MMGGSLRWELCFEGAEVSLSCSGVESELEDEEEEEDDVYV